MIDYESYKYIRSQINKSVERLKEALVVFGTTALLRDACTDDCFDMSGRA